MYEQLLKKSDALRSRYAGTASYPFAQEVSGLINSAEVNANDTVYVERTATVDEWNSIFNGSLEMLLGDCRNAKVVAWFDRNGFKS